VPNRRNHRLRETGPFHRMRWDVDRPRSVYQMWMEVVVERQPIVSTRRLVGSSSSLVPRTLQEERMYPYQIQPVQELVPHDARARHTLRQWILQQSVKGR
jgi:hypothetical protein